MDVRFTPVRFGVGYDQSEVDDFLDRCDRALTTGDGSMTLQSVLEARFSATRFTEGYAMDEVDRFLDDVLVPRFRDRGTDGAGEADGTDGVGEADGAPGADGVASAPAPAPAPASRGPVPHPAERRGGFLSRLLRGR